MNDENIVGVRGALAGIFQRVGMCDIDALVLSEIIMSPEPVSAQQISNVLEKSISGVTMALHRLMNLQLVRRVKVGKTYLYESDGDLLSMFQEVLLDIQTHWIPILRGEIERALEKINEREAEVLRKIDRKARETERKIDMIMDILSNVGGDDYADSFNS